MKNLDKKAKDLIKIYKEIVNSISKLMAIVILIIAKALKNYLNIMIDIKKS